MAFTQFSDLYESKQEFHSNYLKQNAQNTCWKIRFVFFLLGNARNFCSHRIAVSVFK